MTRTAAAARPPMRQTPAQQRPTPPTAIENAINVVLAQLAAKPEADGLATYRYGSWPLHGRFAADARWFDGEAWESVTVQGARTLVAAEQTVIDVLRSRVGGVR